MISFCFYFNFTVSKIFMEVGFVKRATSLNTVYPILLRTRVGVVVVVVVLHYN